MQSFDTGGIGRNITGEKNEVLVQASSKYITLDDIPSHNEVIKVRGTACCTTKKKFKLFCG